MRGRERGGRRGPLSEDSLHGGGELQNGLQGQCAPLAISGAAERGVHIRGTQGGLQEEAAQVFEQDRLLAILITALIALQ